MVRKSVNIPNLNSDNPNYTQPTMAQKTALVTGAAHGIGLATVKILAEAGYHVFLTAREVEEAQAATQNLQSQSLNVEFIELDTSLDEQVNAAVHQVSSKVQCLDALINNAGINSFDRSIPRDSIPLTDYYQTFEANFFGAVRVTQAFLPLLKNSPAGRIVNVSSYHASLTLNSDPTSDVYDGKFGPYNASKSALNSYTNHMAYALKETNIVVNCVHPGWVRTNMGGDNAPMSPEEGAQSAIIMATWGDNPPNGTFTHLGQELPW